MLRNNFFICIGLTTNAIALNYNYQSNANFVFEIQSIILIDEMPKQFNGKVNISGGVENNDEKMKL